MAGGDLTEKIHIKSRDEIGDMVISYNEMQRYLNDLVLDLKQDAEKTE